MRNSRNTTSTRSGVLACLVTAAAGVIASAGSALAQQPREWELGFQAAHSPIARQMHEFHTLLLWIIGGVVVLVLGLLLIVVIRFNQRVNPTPSKTTHNTLIEIVWTAVPVLLLVIIAIQSFPLLYATDDTVDADMTIKAIGRQWYWSYEYPDNGGFGFDSFILRDDELGPDDVRLLSVSEPFVVPVGKKIRVIVTSSDVLHSFAVPSLGVKLDAVPGRLNELWFEIDEPGIYYGQCSELCGAGHGFMPIEVEAKSEEAFNAWVAEAQARFAKVGDDFLDTRPVTVVTADQFAN